MSHSIPFSFFTACCRYAHLHSDCTSLVYKGFGDLQVVHNLDSGARKGANAHLRAVSRYMGDLASFMVTVGQGNRVALNEAKGILSFPNTQPPLALGIELRNGPSPMDVRSYLLRHAEAEALAGSTSTYARRRHPGPQFVNISSFGQWSTGSGFGSKWQGNGWSFVLEQSMQGYSFPSISPPPVSLTEASPQDVVGIPEDEEVEEAAPPRRTRNPAFRGSVIERHMRSEAGWLDRSSASSKSAYVAPSKPSMASTTSDDLDLGSFSGEEVSESGSDSDSEEELTDSELEDSDLEEGESSSSDGVGEEVSPTGQGGGGGGGLKEASAGSAHEGKAEDQNGRRERIARFLRRASLAQSAATEQVQEAARAVLASIMQTKEAGAKGEGDGGVDSSAIAPVVDFHAESDSTSDEVWELPEGYDNGEGDVATEAPPEAEADGRDPAEPRTPSAEGKQKASDEEATSLRITAPQLSRAVAAGSQPSSSGPATSLRLFAVSVLEMNALVEGGGCEE